MNFAEHFLSPTKALCKIPWSVVLVQCKNGLLSFVEAIILNWKVFTYKLILLLQTETFGRLGKNSTTKLNLTILRKGLRYKNKTISDFQGRIIADSIRKVFRQCCWNCSLGNQKKCFREKLSENIHFFWLFFRFVRTTRSTFGKIAEFALYDSIGTFWESCFFWVTIRICFGLNRCLFLKGFHDCPSSFQKNMKLNSKTINNCELLRTLSCNFLGFS